MRRLVTAACISVMFGAMPIQSSAAKYEHVVAKEGFMASVVGKTVDVGGETLVIHADGTITGLVEGTWSWEDGFFCREGTAGGKPMKRDCQKVEVKGKKLRLTRDNGQGKKVVYKLK